MDSANSGDNTRSNENKPRSGHESFTHSALAPVHRHEVDALRYIALFGHIRSQELAQILWPAAASTNSAGVLARRTLSRMVDKRMVIERLNLLGTKSYVLTSRGAGMAESYWGRGLGMWGDTPRGSAVIDGYDLTPAGPNFRHTTLAASYLAWRLSQGYAAWPEFAIDKGWSPVDRDQLNQHWHKAPDGLVFVPDRGTTRVIDWIECESALKPSYELRKVLRLAWKLNRPIAKDSYMRAGRLVIVYDVVERHEQRILRTAVEVAREHADQEAQVDGSKRLADNAPYHLLVDRYKDEFAHVDLVRARVLPPLRVVGFEVVSLYDALRLMYPQLGTTNITPLVQR